jgi:hypothetical protein
MNSALAFIDNAIRFAGFVLVIAFIALIGGALIASVERLVSAAS